jgi:hypothetical protein
MDRIYQYSKMVESVALAMAPDRGMAGIDGSTYSVLSVPGGDALALWFEAEDSVRLRVQRPIKRRSIDPRLRQDCEVFAQSHCK